ncbi:nuclear transport factor 2 family protein, partial [Microterricola pindariensis]|uniref:nuclear transport factor 2 family protein n=1 Tax=Microterricola pindariensis TaxID=478010 RepID=UPI002D7899A6
SENEAITRWVDGYRKAWLSNDPDDIRALFTEDAEYYTRPHREPWRGHEEIVTRWIENADGPGGSTFEWQPVLASPETAVVRGVTRYPGDNEIYHNLWVVQLSPDGRASSFTEWWMEESQATGGSGD